MHKVQHLTIRTVSLSHIQTLDFKALGQSKALYQKRYQAVSKRHKQIAAKKCRREEVIWKSAYGKEIVSYMIRMQTDLNNLNKRSHNWIFCDGRWFRYRSAAWGSATCGSVAVHMWQRSSSYRLNLINYLFANCDQKSGRKSIKNIKLNRKVSNWMVLSPKNVSEMYQKNGYQKKVSQRGSHCRKITVEFGPQQSCLCGRGSNSSVVEFKWETGTSTNAYFTGALWLNPFDLPQLFAFNLIRFWSTRFRGDSSQFGLHPILTVYYRFGNKSSVIKVQE